MRAVPHALRLWAVMIATLVLVAGLLVGTPVPAQAVPALAAAPLTAATVKAAAAVSKTPGAVVQSSTAVSADALPTVQINGVVWAQAISGNTVFAGGRFTAARPAGAAPNTHLTTRGNLLSYNLTTGVLNAAFAPRLNAQVRAVAVTPDGKTLFVGGDFTAADGTLHGRLAAYDIATGKVISTFQANFNNTVDAIVATNATVFVGGTFTAVNGVARKRLAAVTVAKGALTGWAPAADYTVRALVLTPDRTMLIAGGSFKTINGSAAYGLAAISSSNSGVLRPWAAGATVRDAGEHSGITSLSTDGTAIYGTGYVYAAGASQGNLEGTFSANPTTGKINWLEDCHGDTYSAYSDGRTVYTVSHAHYCSPVGGFPESNPTVINQRRALAFTAAATGTLAHDYVATPTSHYKDWFGTPSPSLVDWFPDFGIGTATGVNQAGWSVTGNGKYVIVGGEFPTVNGVGQQGLVRFAAKTAATAKQAPRVSGANFVPRLLSLTRGTVRVSFQSNWDADDLALTYKLVRDNDKANPVFTTTANSTFWNRPTMLFTDQNLVPGTVYTYRLFVQDASGNVVSGDSVTIKVATQDAPSTYSATVLADGATNFWRLNDAATSTVGHDSAGFSDLGAHGGITRTAAAEVLADKNTATTFNGSTGYAATTTKVDDPTIFTEEAWFATTSKTGGKIVGFGDATTGLSALNDRNIYMDTAGRLYFGVRGVSANEIISSTGTYNDGKWHQVAASVSSAGMTLYVDGVRVATKSGTVASSNYSGYWRVGGDTAWSGAPYFKGSIADVSIYATALTPARIAAHYAAALTANRAPVAAFESTATNLAVTVDGSTSTDPDGTVASYLWDFGDGTSAKTATAAHTYASAGTYPVTLTVTDNQGMAGSITRSVVVALPNVPPTASFTVSPTYLSVVFDGSKSADSDGSITGYAWDFGDGGTATTASATHAYAAAGSYQVTLTVTDDRGATTAATQTVTVQGGGGPSTSGH